MRERNATCGIPASSLLTIKCYRYLRELQCYLREQKFLPQVASLCLIKVLSHIATPACSFTPASGLKWVVKGTFHSESHACGSSTHLLQASSTGRARGAQGTCSAGGACSTSRALLKNYKVFYALYGCMAVLHINPLSYLFWV